MKHPELLHSVYARVVSASPRSVKNRVLLSSEWLQLNKAELKLRLCKIKQ